MLLHAMGLLVLTDDVLPLNEWRDVLFERLPRPDIEAAMSKVEAIAKPAESKPYDQLRRKWRGARKLLFEITNRIETDAAPGEIGDATGRARVRQSGKDQVGAVTVKK